MTKGSLPLMSLFKLIKESLNNKDPFESVFFFINGKFICKQSNSFTTIQIFTFQDELIEKVYYEHKDEDGFLYIVYTSFSSFG